MIALRQVVASQLLDDGLHRTAADLDIEFVRPNGQTRRPRWVLEVLVYHDRNHTEQVRALRERTSRSGDLPLATLELTGKGLKTRQIAAALHLSIKTVQVYCGRIKDKLSLAFDDLGPQMLKNIPAPVRAFRVRIDGVTAPRQAGSTLKPFLYGLAIEQRMLTAASVLDDSPLAVTTPKRSALFLAVTAEEKGLLGSKYYAQNPIVPRAGMKQQMIVIATYSDGTRRDVTREAFIESGNIEVIEANSSGVLTMLRRGEAPVLVRYEGAYATTTIDWWFSTASRPSSVHSRRSSVVKPSCSRRPTIRCATCSR